MVLSVMCSAFCTKLAAESLPSCKPRAQPPDLLIAFLFVHLLTTTTSDYYPLLSWGDFWRLLVLYFDLSNMDVLKSQYSFKICILLIAEN